MNDWHWFVAYELEARARGDDERAKLGQLHREAFGFRETDPERTVLLFTEGRRLAQALDEPWWVLLFDHWRVHSTLYYKRDYRHILDAAVRNALEVRKPDNRAFPQRLWILNDLVNIYLNLDPLGYTAEAEQTLTEADAEVTPEMDNSRYLLRESRVDVALTQYRFDDANHIALSIQAQAFADPDRWTANHFLISNYQTLCYIANLRKQWAEIAGWADAGEALARQEEYQHAIAAFLMWQAAVLQRAGDKSKAARNHRNAAARMGRLNTPLSEDNYAALCSYHELCGDLEKSLHLRDQQLKEAVERGMIRTAFETRLARLPLLARMGRDSGPDLADARAAAQKFRRPEPYLEQLKRIRAGC